MTRGVAVQKGREQPFDRFGRRGNAQHVDIAPSKLPRPVTQRRGVTQQVPAFSEKLLAPRAEEQTPPDPLEQRKAQFQLQADDLPGQRRLGNVEDLRGFRHAALLGDSHKCADAFQVHRNCLCQYGMKNTHYALDREPSNSANERRS